MLPLMNYGGRINFFGGIPAHKEPVPIDTNLVHYKELYLTGSTRSSISQYRKVLELVSAGLLQVNDIITGRYNISEALDAFNNAKQALGLKHAIIF